MPLFVGPEPFANDELPGLGRHAVDSVVGEADELAGLGVKALILFGIPEEKDEEGSGAYDEDGIVQRALRALRGRHPQLTLLTDVCLCEYTSHGHCGVLAGDDVDNDETLKLLARTAVSHVEAGARPGAPRARRGGRGAARLGAHDRQGCPSAPDPARPAQVPP